MMGAFSFAPKQGRALGCWWVSKTRLARFDSSVARGGLWRRATAARRVGSIPVVVAPASSVRRFSLGVGGLWFRVQVPSGFHHPVVSRATTEGKRKKRGVRYAVFGGDEKKETVPD